MADNWSASTVVLANAGDWAKWTVDVPDTTAATNLNGPNGGTASSFVFRGAMSRASSPITAFLLIINDIAARVLAPDNNGGRNLHASSGAWISANRFSSLSGGGPSVWALVPLADQDEYIVTPSGPGNGAFVVGTNTVRLLNLGVVDTGVDESIEVDFVAIQQGGTVSFNGPFGSSPGLGTDSVSESTPAGFSSHTDPNPIASETHGWLLKGDQASAGHAEPPTIDLVKLCAAGSNLVGRIRVTDGFGSPLAGAGIVYYGGGSSIVTLDGAGKAEFLIPGLTPTALVFGYGGSDAFAPGALVVDPATRLGCAGWHIGRIGVGN